MNDMDLTLEQLCVLWMRNQDSFGDFDSDIARKLEAAIAVAGNRALDRQEILQIAHQYCGEE